VTTLAKPKSDKVVITPDDIAAQSLAAAEAGASILHLHVRDPKDLIQVSMEDSASAISSAEAMVAANTPASRIRLERFGKSSIALARCNGSENGAPPDQSAYEPLFRRASEVLANYRSLLGVRHTVPAELAQIPAAAASQTATKPKSTKPAAKKK